MFPPGLISGRTDTKTNICKCRDGHYVTIKQQLLGLYQTEHTKTSTSKCIGITIKVQFIRKIGHLYVNHNCIWNWKSTGFHKEFAFISGTQVSKIIFNIIFFRYLKISAQTSIPAEACLIGSYSHMLSTNMTILQKSTVILWM